MITFDNNAHALTYNDFLECGCSKTATLEELKSEADCVIYTYGAAGGVKWQETPSYVFKRAKENPHIRYELVHSDPLFAKNRSICMQSEEWELLEGSLPGIFRFRHVTLKNLSVRLLQREFPEEQNQPHFSTSFLQYLTDKLQQGCEIFLGAHFSCFIDTKSCMGSVYNTLRERFSGKIHFYTQGSDLPAFIYEGRYSKIFAIFAMCCKYLYQPDDWKTFTRLFSREGFSLNTQGHDKAHMRDIAQNLFKTPCDAKVAELFACIPANPKDYTPEQFYSYLDNPTDYKVVVVNRESL